MQNVKWIAEHRGLKVKEIESPEWIINGEDTVLYIIKTAKCKALRELYKYLLRGETPKAEN